MRVLILASAALLGACGQSAVAPDTSAPALSLGVLTESDLSAPLSGELGCSFSVRDGVLLLAKGDVDDQARSHALAKRDGAVVQLEATEQGGYDGIVDHAFFASGGLTVEIIQGAEAQTGNEQVAHNATLRARSGGQEQTYAGVWTCGP